MNVWREPSHFCYNDVHENKIDRRGVVSLHGGPIQASVQDTMPEEQIRSFLHNAAINCMPPYGQENWWGNRRQFMPA
jgi:hypothetical protein